MSQPLTKSPTGSPRHSLRRLGSIIAAYVVYGALLFGTSAILANPETAQVESRQDAFPNLRIGSWQPVLPHWSTSTVRLGTAAH